MLLMDGQATVAAIRERFEQLATASADDVVVVAFSDHLTPLGRLAGESAVEVETLIRAVDCLRPLHTNEVTDAALITVAQTSVELDAVYFPMNKKSTQKEPLHWMGELQRQGISHAILGNLRRNITEQSQATARAKKAAVCLYYVSGMSMAEIENAVGQFGGAFGGSAGPIRAVTSRTCDVLPMIARAAELLHPGIELQERTSRLLLRLDLGIPGQAVDIARYVERDFDRADYRRLCEARPTAHDAIAAANDATLLGVLANDIRKVAILRKAVDRWRAARPPRAPAAAVPQYQQ